MRYILPLLVVGQLQLMAQTQSPKEFLGYELGERFTHHHKIVDYFEHLDSSSDQLTLTSYGETNEGRPLLLAFLSSAENLSKLEEIRSDNLKRAKILNGNPSDDIPIIWLSYNVHGNESSSSEAVMRTAYELLSADSKFNKYLSEAVIVLDPCINPDGRERYVHFYEQWGQSPYTKNGTAAEHREIWPGGRENHYLFDLNRDWAWQTQKESIQRMEVYNQWLPHIHVDFHEQGAEDNYYFAPAAAPYHELITNWQKEFQVVIGKNHAKYFDENGWLYFTKEVFDLLYPSYGDTYPTYNGAIGMTYEQAGGGRGGLGIDIHGGETLTLKDRIAHHNTTGLSTVEIATENKGQLLSEFSKFFERGVAATSAKFKSFIIKNTNQDRIDHLMEWLDKLGIQYGSVNTIRSLKGYHYQSKSDRSFTLESKDLVIPVNQPKSVFAQILFEPITKLQDSLTYDITAWSAPFFYGLDAYGSQTAISLAGKPELAYIEPESEEKAPYAIAFKWNSLKDAKFLAALFANDLNVRFVNQNVSYEDNNLASALLIPRAGNGDNYHKKVNEIAKKYKRNPINLTTGFANYGPDLGSESVAVLEKPKIALIGGLGTSKLSFGQNRFFLEQELKYPHTIIRTDYITNVDLDEFNVIIMPEGSYYNLSDTFLDGLMEWVSDGGKLIVVGYSVSKFRDNDRGALTTYFNDDEEGRFDEELSKDDALKTSRERGRDWLNDALSGAIYKSTLDITHPLSAGLGDSYYTLKTSGMRVSYMQDGDNVGTIRSEGDLMAGFVGEQLQEKLDDTLVFGVEEQGRGAIVYFVDNPLFRNFWYEGKLLYANALFLVGN